MESKLSSRLIKPLVILSFMGLPLISSLNHAYANPNDKEKASAPTQKQEDTEADRSLTKLLENPVISNAFDQAQMHMLRTSIDLQVGQVLEMNPMIQAMYPMLENELKSVIVDSVIKNDFSMTELDPTIPAHLEILNIARRAALDTGDTAAQVAAKKFYVAMGPVNAYTQGGVFVVVYDSLIDKMKYSKNVEIKPAVFKIEKNPKTGETTIVQASAAENKQMQRIKKLALKGVYLHELGHIKAGHVMQGIMLSTIIMQLAKIFAPDLLNGQDANTFFKQFGKQNQNTESQVFWDGIFESLIPHIHGPEANAHEKEHLVSAMVQMNKMMDSMAQSSEPQVKSLLIEFIETMKDVVARSEMPPQTWDFLNHLSTMLQSQTDLGSNQVISGKSFAENIKSLAALVSREQETSADFYMYMGVPPHMATIGDLIFSAAPMDKTPEDWAEYVKEIKDNIRSKQNQLKEAYSLGDKKKLDEVVGGTNLDHPTAAVRIDNIMAYAQTVDVVSMRNPFLRLMVVRNAIQQQQILAQKMITRAQAQLDQTEAQAKAPKQIIDGLNRFITEQQNILKESAVGYQTLTTTINEIIGDEGFDHYNPALFDLLHYQLARKNQVARGLEHLTEAFKNAKTPEEKQMIQKEATEMQAYATKGDDLVKSLLSSPGLAKLQATVASKNAKVTSTLVATMQASLNKDLQPAEIKTLRAGLYDVTPQGKTATLKLSQIEDDPRFVDRTSSLRHRYVSPEEEKAMQAEVQKKTGIPQDRSHFFNPKPGANVPFCVYSLSM